MVDHRTNNAKAIISSLRQTGDMLRVFDTEIPFSVRAAESSIEGKSIFSHDGRGKVAAAYTVFICKDCDLTYKGEYTDALGHNYKAVVTAPTCNDKGYTTYTCTRCGKSYVDNYTDALGHDWDNGTKITDATCNGAGVIQYHCKRCDATYLEAISATGHKPGPKATCTEPQLCMTCGAVLTKPTGHNYKATVTPATCEAMGYTTYTCRKCGDTYKADYTDVLGHNYIAVVTAPTYASSFIVYIIKTSEIVIGTKRNRYFY